jgi:hypothetical protein
MPIINNANIVDLLEIGRGLISMGSRVSELMIQVFQIIMPDRHRNRVKLLLLRRFSTNE